MNHPLQPLNPMQRLGWLQHFTRIRCTKAFASFRAGLLYPLTTTTAIVNRAHTRILANGGAEHVILTGMDLLIKISDTPILPSASPSFIPHPSSLIPSLATHRFLATPQSPHPWIHNLEFLIAHFAIPEILDQAALQPHAFVRYQEKLRALERTAT